MELEDTKFDQEILFALLAKIVELLFKITSECRRLLELEDYVEVFDQPYLYVTDKQIHRVP